MKRTKKYQVHDIWGTKVGQTVRFTASKPYSKTKKWKIIGIENGKSRTGSTSSTRSAKSIRGTKSTKNKSIRNMKGNKKKGDRRKKSARSDNNPRNSRT